MMPEIKTYPQTNRLDLLVVLTTFVADLILEISKFDYTTGSAIIIAAGLYWVLRFLYLFYYHENWNK
jgi:hypothetical protein